MDSWSVKVFNASLSNIRSLVVGNIGCHIYEDPVNTKPSIVFRMSNPIMLEGIQVNETELGNAGNELMVDFSTVHIKNAVSGQYLIDVYIPTATLNKIHVASDFSVAMYPNTFNTDVMGDISIVSSGRGVLLLQSAAINVKRLLVSTHSTGFIQLEIDDTLSADQIDMVAVESGLVAVVSGETSTDELGIATVNSGGVYFSAKPLITKSLAARVYSDGSIILPEGGSSTRSYLQADGSGTLYTNYIKSNTATAVLLGNGNIYLNAVNKLETQDDGVGEIFAAVTSTTNVTGPFQALESVAIPSFLKYDMPVHAPVFIQFESIRNTSLFPASSPGDEYNSIGAGGFFLLFGGITMLLGAFASFLVYRKLKQIKSTATDTELKFKSVKTPTSDARKVMSF